MSHQHQGERPADSRKTTLAGGDPSCADPNLAREEAIGTGSTRWPESFGDPALQPRTGWSTMGSCNPSSL